MPNTLDIAIYEQARLSRDARFDGKFFTAVSSTGIFCRPICPARPPKPENVRYYLSAEQAQHAGYTPCKRCFPEQASTKSMPIKLSKILQTFDFKEHTISSIAEKHQLSTRQVQRLFVANLGLPPSEFFQQQRLLLARKLISTTQLSMSDICFACGFNSIRRFNEAIKAAYQCTPSQLKRKKSTNEQTNHVSISLFYRPPFDWQLMLAFFQHRQIHGMEHVDENSYQRNVKFSNCSGWLKVEHHKTKPALQLTVSLSDYSYLNNIIGRVRRMFDLDADIQLIHQQLNSHPKLAEAITKYPGLRLPGCWDIFEFSIRAILGQQISVKAATTLAKRIALTYGEKNESLPEQICHSFPSVEALLAVDFQGLGLTQTRIATLQRWVSFYQDKNTIFEHYLSLTVLEQQLCEIKGIGPWTVNYIAMRGLSDPDAFPSADLGIIKALTEDGKVPKNNDILALAEQWRPWRAYAAIYLWHSLH